MSISVTDNSCAGLAYDEHGKRDKESILFIIIPQIFFVHLHIASNKKYASSNILPGMLHDPCLCFKSKYCC